MAEGELVPDAHHVVRYCKNTQVTNGVASGAAFQLEGTHQELSVNWLEHLHPAPDRVAQLRAARAAMEQTLRLKDNGWFAVLAGGCITSLTELSGTALALLVRHHPEDGNDGHSAVHGLPEIGSSLATAVGLELASRVTEAAIQLRNM